MDKKIKAHALGKLRIYIEPAHKVRHGERSLFRKIFPKSAYIHILTEAKKDGILNASVYNTHGGYSSAGNIQSFSPEGDNSKLSMCVELIAKKEELEQFFLKHRDLLRSKVVIYKDVEFWDID
jgi:PII-like signaling protein